MVKGLQVTVVVVTVVIWTVKTLDCGRSFDNTSDSDESVVDDEEEGGQMNGSEENCTDLVR